MSYKYAKSLTGVDLVNTKNKLHSIKSKSTEQTEKHHKTNKSEYN